MATNFTFDDPGEAVTETFTVNLHDGRVLKIPATDSEHAIELAQTFMATNPMETVRSDAGGLQIVNRGIAGGLGAPVDLANAGLSVIGLGSQQPIGGRESIIKGLNVLADLTGQDPIASTRPAQGFAENVLEGGGLAVGGGPVMLGGARAGATALELAGRAPALVAGGRQLAQQGAKPSLIAADVFSGMAAGGGGEIAVELAEDERARVWGNLLGGFAPSLALNTPGVRVGINSLRASVTPFTSGGATIRAKKRLQSFVDDPNAADASLAGPNEGGLSSAQRVGGRVLRLEKAVRDKNAEIDDKIELQIAESQQSLRESARVPGNVQNTREALESRREALQALLQARLTQAMRKTEQLLAKLDPRQRSTQSSVIARNQIDEAEGAARAQERDLYSDVDITETTSPTTTRATYKTIVDNLDPDADDISDVFSPRLIKLMGRANEDGIIEGGTLSDDVKVKTLQSVRSRILREVREERAKDAPDRNKIRLLDDMQKSVLADMETSEAGPALRLALDFSKDLNDRFTRGPVGDLLGNTRQGGAEVPAQATLETALTGGQARPVVAIEALQGAGVNPAEIKNFYLNQFDDQARVGGEFSVRAAERFLVANKEVLDLDGFGDIRKQITDAIESARETASRQGKVDVITKEMTNPKIGAAGKFLGARVGDEINSVATSQNPKAAALDLWRRTRNNPEAREGLGAGLIETIMQRAKTGTVDETGKSVLSGARLQSLLSGDSTNSKAIQAMARQFLSPSQRSRMRVVANRLRKLESARISKSARGGVISDVPSTLLAIPARVLAAQAGGRLSAGGGFGGSLQTANIFSARAKSWLVNLTKDKAEVLLTRAIEEKDASLFRILLEPVNNPAKQARTLKRLHSWLIGPGREIFDLNDFDDPEDEE